MIFIIIFFLLVVFSAKIVVHVSVPGPIKKPGPVTSSRNDFIRFSFREAGEGQVRMTIQTGKTRTVT